MGTARRIAFARRRCSSSPGRRRSSRRRIRPAPIRATDSSPASSTPASRRAGCSSSRSRPSRPRSTRLRGLTFINSDLAFRDNYVYQGNFSGFIDLGREESGEAGARSRRSSVRHVAGRSVDLGNLLFISAEGNGNRNDCAKGGIKDTTDHTSHMTGVRIYDVSNPRAPKLIKNVQTCKGSHTHTIDPDPNGQGHDLHLCVGQPRRASGDGARRLQER